MAPLFLQLLPFLLVAAGFMALRIWIRAKVRRIFEQRDSQGREVEATPDARFGVANLPIDVATVAKAGSGADPRRSLNVTLLRPTPGLRMISLGFGGLILMLLWTSAGAGLVPGPDWVKQVISAFVLYSMVYITVYEVRYDDRVIIAPDWLLRSREYPWAGLLYLRDDGHYVYRLRFTDGRRMELQKYLVGIREFLAEAHDRIEGNLTRG